MEKKWHFISLEDYHEILMTRQTLCDRILLMKKKPLIETNPYLKNPEKLEEMIARAVLSSTAIEGVKKAARKALDDKKTIATKRSHE